jgi:DNA-binding XRE family transcriptional regulator
MPQRPRTLTPEASPKHLFGALLREWRQRRKLSQAQLGALVYVSADLVAKVEKAVRWPSKELASRCDAVLNTGGVLMELLPIVDHERRRMSNTKIAAGSSTVAGELSTPRRTTSANAIAPFPAGSRRPAGGSGGLAKPGTSRFGLAKSAQRRTTPRGAALAFQCSCARLSA